MTKTNQFWALFKFQLRMNPFVWFMTFGFFGLIFIQQVGALAWQLSTPNIFFVTFIGVFILAPDLITWGNAGVASSTGTEFLMTRALDRRLLCRAKTTVFYLVVLLIPLALLLGSLPKPHLEISVRSEVQQKIIQNHLPGTLLLHDTQTTHGKEGHLLIPMGKLLVRSWQIWKIFLAAILTQLALWLIAPFKRRRVMLGILYFGMILLPFVPLLSHDIHHPHASATEEMLFFFFSSHQSLVWLGTLLVCGAAQFWSEWRFARIEF